MGVPGPGVKLHCVGLVTVLSVTVDTFPVRWGAPMLQVVPPHTVLYARCDAANPGGAAWQKDLSDTTF